MKFVNLLFLFALILIVNIKATAYKRIFSYNRHVADTIIKLDTNIKFFKPVKIKKPAANTSNKVVNTSKDVTQINTLDNSRSTAIVDTIVKNDTTKKSLKISTVLPTVQDTTKKGSDLDTELKDIADSVYNDMKTAMSYRIGNARVTYGDFELDAEYIRIDRKKKLIFASGMRDPKTGRYIGRPISKQGKDAPILSDSLLFNYETKKGHIWNISTQQEGNYISKGQAKKLNEEEVALANVIFSACDKPDPDYGIVITKGIAEEKRIISGPAYLVIQDIPLPIGLPFGFFPKTNSRTSGLLLPTFGEDATLGFFLRDFGYYLALSDYADLTNLATYYSNGSYEVSSSMDYMKRYKYNGNLTLSYGSHNYTLPGDPPARDFHINWLHSQNPAASPGSTFSASVNAGTSSFYRNNPATTGYNMQALTQNLLRSSISYSRTWAGTPFNLTTGVSHSQDLSARTVSLELPNVNFSMTSINPFDSKDRVDEQKWYQKITMAYTMQATNRISALPESELFKKETLTKKLQNGIQHQIPVGINFNLLNYFQFSGSVNYQDRWYFQTIKKHYARADSLVTDTVPGFSRVGNYNLSASVSTKIYGLLNFKNSKLMAIRHVMTPNIGFSYTPNYGGLDRSYNRLIVSNATVPYPVVYQRYSIYQNSIYGGPSGGRQAGISFGLDNNLEAKLRPRSTDTLQQTRKIQLLQSLSFSTFYNFAADSFRLSPIAVSGHVGLFHDKVNVSFGGTLDPYVTRVFDSISNNQIVPYRRQFNRYTWQDGKIPQLVNFNFSVSGTLNPAAFHPSANNNNNIANGLALANATPQQRQNLALLNSDPSAYIDFNIPWNLVVNYNFNYTNGYVSSQRTNTVMLSGDLSLTKAWKVQFNTNYDFVAGQISSATSFAIYRDLHCWDLSIQWVPFGFYKSYNVTLRVKSPILQALKLSKRSDYTSNANFNR